MTIKAITFDFWNTLYSDQGYAYDRVSPLRLQAMREAVELCGGAPTDDELTEAARAGFDAYLEAWKGGRHFGAKEDIEVILAFFGLVPRHDVVARAVAKIEDLGALAELRVLPGVREALPRLAAMGVKLGLISDTGLTPGRVLTRFLEQDGLLPHISALTFSDVTGYPKPDPRMFLATLAPLGVPPEEAAHVGDTPRSDIAGAKALGMTAIRFAAVKDHQEPPEADLVIKDHRELLELLEF